MRIRLGRWPRLAVFGAALLLSATTALAQSSGDQTLNVLVGGVFLLIALTLGVGVYIYFALALRTIALKTGTPNAWLAWVPIVHLFLMLNIARRPAWWFVLLFVPLVNIVIVVIIWMGIARQRRKPDWLGILMIVPLANIVIPGVLAWAD